MEKFETAMRELLLLTKSAADEKAFRENYMLVLRYTTAVRQGAQTAQAVEQSLAEFLRELEASPVKTFTPLIERCVCFAVELGRIIDEQNISFHSVQALIASASMMPTVASTLDSIRIVSQTLTVEFELLRLVLLLKQANLEKSPALFKDALTTFLAKVQQPLDKTHNTPLADLKRMVAVCKDQASAFNNDAHLEQLLLKTFTFAQVYLRAYALEDVHKTD